MRRLLVYQAIWAMENTPGVDLEGDLDGALDRIFAAGFDGVGVSLGRRDRAQAVADGVATRGGTWEASAFVRTGSDLAHGLEFAQSRGAHHVNVQILEKRDRVRDAVALLAEMQEAAQTCDLPVYYETHRGRLTNDLLFTLRILDEMPDLLLTGDLSHYPLVHEFPMPVPEAELARMSRILARCAAFHGRVCSSHQVQVSILAKQHQPWVEQFQAWWSEGFQSWATRSPPNAELTFMSELGPPSYAITDAAGGEISDRWTEALALKSMARAIWDGIAK